MDKKPKLHRKKEEMDAKELISLLKGVRFKLDCGHHFQIHPLSNTMIMYCDGKTA